LLRGDLDVINLVTVKVLEDTASRELVELLDGADADDLSSKPRSALSSRSGIKAAQTTHLLVIITSPERERSSPVTVTRDVPVTGVLEPRLETILADRGGDPASLLVVLDELVGRVLDADEPDGDDTVDEGSAGAGDETSQRGERADDNRQNSPPAEGVRVLDSGGDDELVLSLEVFDDDLVGVL
jgi:hypothetical protein